MIDSAPAIVRLMARNIHSSATCILKTVMQEFTTMLTDASSDLSLLIAGFNDPRGDPSGYTQSWNESRAIIIRLIGGVRERFYDALTKSDPLCGFML